MLIRCVLSCLAALGCGVFAYRVSSDGPTTAVAVASAYRECKIVNGQVFSCDGAWYQGQTVALKDGAYRECKIVNGQVFSCDGAWYQGEAVVLTDR